MVSRLRVITLGEKERTGVQDWKGKQGGLACYFVQGANREREHSIDRSGHGKGIL
jgi:hypothetical protein